MTPQTGEPGSTPTSTCCKSRRPGGPWKKDCPMRGPPQKPCPFCYKSGHWDRDFLKGRRAPGPERACTMALNWRTPTFQLAPTKNIIIEEKEPRVTLEVAGRPLTCLLDSRAAFFGLTSYWGSPLSAALHRGGEKAQGKVLYSTLNRLWGAATSVHQFLVMTESLTPLLGRDILDKVKTLVIFFQ